MWWQCLNVLMSSADNQGLSLKVLQEKINSNEGQEKVGEDPRNGQKQGLMDPAQGPVPSLGEKAPVVRDSFSRKHPSITPWGVEIVQEPSPPS